MIAPVSVARSMTNFGLELLLRVGERVGEHTRRPSASVFSTSMVWPDIDLTTSSGRCALPEGMFSTKPMTPTALTRAFRAASACIVPTTAAAATHVALHAHHAGAWLERERPPESKHTPLRRRRRWARPFFARAPFQCMTTSWPLALAALAHAQKRAHAELLHLRFAEDLDLHAELAELRLGAAREFGRVEHVRRFVDEIAGEEHAARNGFERCPGALGTRRVAAADGDAR